MDVSAWLRGLGLGQYETAFRDNAIDDGVLPSLTSDDLKEIGVSAIGHRRRMLDAIATLRRETDCRATPTADEQSPVPSPAAPSRDSAERRPITVMFCDLVGSTSLAAMLDAEDWRDLVGAYLDEASKAVAQYGGHVLKKLGDGIMALFGYPKAQENDAERAARAGLAILRALDDLNAKNEGKGQPRLAARIGLESGPVVVDSTGEVFGDAPNVAARVQSAAEPGTLLVTAAVQRQVAGLFIAEDKGPHELKGVPGKLTLYRLVRASGAGRRTGARSLTPLIGREEELAALARRWERAKAGDGQFAQIVGEPGLGKSRLLEEFRIRLGETPHTWVEWASSQLLQNTPLHPIAEWGRQRFTSEAKFAELEGVLTQVKLDPAEYAPLLAPLLDISVPEPRALQFAADELRRKQLAAVVAWLLAGARAQPVVLAFEDLHWADPTTLDLMKTLAERGSQAPLLIAATTRPEFRAPWMTRSHHSILGLSPLDRSQIGQMVGAIAERHALSREIVEGLTDRTAGVPLFIEELTRLMLEGGAQAIPPTLQQSLAARLDRLGEARELAQIGAVLGREFSYALLQAVADRPDPALEGALERLADADLLFVEGIAPSSSYRFKHALIQDAAYESLLKVRRQALHRSAARTLISGSDPHPELVAHHFTQAGDTEPAVEWWGKAGDAALRRSAFQEAISHLGKAIELSDSVEAAARPAEETVKEEREKRRQRVSLHANYARAVQWAKGFSDEDTRAAYERASDLAANNPDNNEYWSTLNGRWAVHFSRAEHEMALGIARDYMRRARASKQSCHMFNGYRLTGQVQSALAHYEEAKREFEAMEKCWEEEHAERLRGVTPGDALCSGSIFYAEALLITGDIATALAKAEQAVRRAEARNDFQALAFALNWGCISLQHIGRVDALSIWATKLQTVVAEREAQYFSISARAHMTIARGLLGHADAAIGSLAEIISIRRKRQELLALPTLLAGLADLQVVASRHDDAIATIGEALAFVGQTGERQIEAALHRRRGDVLLHHDRSAAEAALREAVCIARAQGARTFELLAALPFARLLQSTNRCIEAHNVLAPALEGFAPTPEMPAIAEAQALLLTLQG
jgi:class 3 adenylate cyclase/tetratricopeptide (TPR) repeat protein